MPFDFNSPAESGAFNVGKESPIRNAMVRDEFDGTFTLRFWYKQTTLNVQGVNFGYDAGVIPLYLFRWFKDETSDWWGIRAGGNGLEMVCRSHGTVYVRASQLVTFTSIGNYMHVVAGYVRQTATGSGHIFMEIDEGPFFTIIRNFLEVPPMGPMPAADGWGFTMRSTGENGESQFDGSAVAYYDEIAIWRSYLTEAQSTIDVNGGAGVGLSSTPQADKLVAYWNCDAFFTSSPFKTLRDEIQDFDLVANRPWTWATGPPPDPGEAFPNGTGEIVAGKIGNAINMFALFDPGLFGGGAFLGDTNPPSAYIMANPNETMDFGVPGE